MNRINPKKLYRFLSTAFALLFILVGTTIVIMYANGYRFNRETRNVRQTGVITVETNPSRSQVSLNGEEDFRTPKTFNSLVPGIYSILVTREGYLPWKKSVEVFGEKSVPVSAFLFRENRQQEEVFVINEEVVSSVITSNNNRIFILTKKNVQNSETTSNVYKIWSYTIDPPIWEIGSNPHLLLEITLSNEIDPDLLPNPSGTKLLIRIKNDKDSTQEQQLLNYYLLSLDQFYTELPDNQISQMLSSSEVESITGLKWSADGRSLLYVNNDTLFGIDTERIRKQEYTQLLPEQSWDTTENGFLYFTRHMETDEDELITAPYYQIMQRNLYEGDQNSENILLNKIYYTETAQFLQSQAEVKELEELQIPFTSSPDNPSFAGKVIKITIFEELEKVVLETEFALYWHDLETDKYTLIYPEKSHLHGVSPDDTQLLFSTTKGIGVFRFDKEEADISQQLGTKIILSDKEFNNVRWFSNASYVSYTEATSIKVVDTEGLNNYTLAEKALSPYAFGSGGESLYFITESNTGNKAISRSRIN